MVMNLNVNQKKLKELYIIEQEVKIAKTLACNNLVIRNKQLQKLPKWLKLRSRSSFPITEENFIRIWKGLYYCMWYSDKPLVQEDLAEKFGALLNCFDGNVKLSVLFFTAFLKTMCIEWFGIDQWRMDKFMMLVRRMLRYMFKELKQCDWKVALINEFNERTSEIILADEIPVTGLTMHYFDVFFEELAKIADGSILEEQVDVFLHPFVRFMVTQKDNNLVSHCRSQVFYYLLYQSSLGRDYLEKYNAWKEMGFPSNNINDLEKEDDISEEAADEIKKDHRAILDPRAGNVDVFMPELPFNSKYVIDKLEELLLKNNTTTKRRKMLRRLLNVLQTYQKGEFPLGVKTITRVTGKESSRSLIKNKIKRLENFENELYSVNRKLKQLNKNKRRRLLKSINYEDVDEENFDEVIEQMLPHDDLLKRKKRVQSIYMSDWQEEELDETDLPTQLKKPKITHNVIEDKSNYLKGKTDEVINMGDNGLCMQSNTKLNEISINAKCNNNEKKFPSINSTKRNNEIDKHVNDCDVLKDKQKVSIKKTVKESVIPSPIVTFERMSSDLKKNLNPILCSRRIKSISKKPYHLNNGKKMVDYFTHTLKTPPSTKRVRIVLKHNTSQNPQEYIQQIKSSPSVPYDANKRPSKSVLKLNTL